jgi:hypothetical protein
MSRLILALDLATNTGFAYGAANSERPAIGSIRLGAVGAGHGEKGFKLLRWLQDFLAVQVPSAVYLEAPLPPSHMGGRTNAQTLRQMSGLPFLVEAVCFAWNVPVFEATPHEVRKHFLGTTRLERQEAKRQTIARCRMFGWEVANDDAADAAALWHYAAALTTSRLPMAARA